MAHATLVTGADPSRHGIIGNDWAEFATYCNESGSVSSARCARIATMTGRSLSGLALGGGDAASASAQTREIRMVSESGCLTTS